MKKIILIIATVLTTAFAFSQASDTWTQKADFAGKGREGAVGFSIGEKGYIGGGNNNGGLNDFWEYDPGINAWTQKADIGGSGRNAAVGFSIGTKGYVGTGRSGDTFLNDFWEYDPIKNNWTQKADFAGTGRERAVGFSIGSNGYIGTGWDGTYPYLKKDFWEYDPSSDTWTRKADFTGAERRDAVSFNIGSKGWIGTGYSANGHTSDFWEYDPSTDYWTQKADFEGTSRSGAVGFSIGSKGYMGMGSGESGYSNDFWEYNPGTNSWTIKTDFAGTGRYDEVGFSIGSKGYIGTGGNSSASYSNDFWEYTPAPAACPAPINLRVPKISDTAALLKWTLPVDPVSSFLIRYWIVGSSTGFKDRIKGSRSKIVLTGLSPNTSYAWQIRSNCEADTTGWVRGPNFTTLSSASFSSISASVNGVKAQGSASIQIMPNPNRGSFTMQMHLPDKAASTTLSLYNNLGARLWQQDAGILSGSVSRNVVLENKLSAGVYVMMIQHGDIRLMQKVVVVK